MKLTNFAPWLLTAGMTACIPVAKDDTAGLDDEPSSEPASQPSSDEPGDEPSDEPPASTLEPDFLLFYISTAVQNGVELIPVPYENGESPGSLAVIIASDEWGGMDDAYNACYIFFDVTAETATFDTNFVDAGALAGWTIDAANANATTGGACDSLSEDWQAEVANYQATNYGFGFGALQGELLTDLQGAVTDGGGDWDADWAPNVLASFIYFEGMQGGPQAVNYTFSYSLETLETMPFDAEQTVLTDGVYQGQPFYGFGFQ